MRNDFLQLAFYAIALVIGAACEEFLPKAFGVGVPVLFALAVGVASRKSVPTLILFALVAGAFEDALSTLPTMTSPCFFLVGSLIAWRTHYEKITLILAYPFYEIWLAVIVPDIAGSLAVRFLMACVTAALTAFVVCPMSAWLERKAALDAD